MTFQSPNDVFHASSYRDPNGFMFVRDGILYRQVNTSYAHNYDHLLASGLYSFLVNRGELIAHDEELMSPADPGKGYKTLRPEIIPFISYPAEWSFTQLKDAALVTLSIQRSALDHKMSLKDASAFNIQFKRGRPVFIDTLSFEILEENKPWIAYRQFCEHFLAPLSLMAKVDVRLGLMQHQFINGIPLDLACSLLPSGTKLRPSFLVHLHLHATSQKHFEGKSIKENKLRMGMNALYGLIDSLENTVRKLSPQNHGKGWTQYYSTCTYNHRNLKEKERFVGEVIDSTKPTSIWDIGCNTGTFSFICAGRAIHTLALDSDHGSVDRLYKECRSRGEENILPLVVDIASPPGAIGWGGEERSAFLDRGKPELVLALALVHHLAISNNVPLNRIAAFFADIGPLLAIEFVPKDDPQTRRLLGSREDIFENYSREDFEREFGKLFRIERKMHLSDSTRIMYLMRRVVEPVPRLPTKTIQVV